MCSVNESGDIEDLSNSVPISKLKTKIQSDKCNKCKENKPHIILRNKDSYCKDCFLSSTNHKFRALLGKHRLIKGDDRILIYYKGGHPTTSLLHFLKTGLEADNPKKIRYSPVCLFVENQYNLPEVNSREIILHEIADEARKFNFPLFFSSFNQFYKSGGTNVYITNNIEDMLRETTVINKTDCIFGTSGTLVNDLEKIYERRLLISAAKKLNCKFIFSTELSSDIARQILSDVVIGRGSHIPSNSGFCDSRDEDVSILRPLRLFDLKELALYNYFHKLDPIILNVKPSNSSIQNLIGNFVDELQSSYPATVTTILKTGDKLSMASSRKTAVEICYICQGPIEVPSQILSSSRAVKFSCKISKPKRNICMESNEGERRKTCFSCSKIEEFLL